MEAGDGKSLVFMPGDYNFAVQIRQVNPRGIHGDNITILNEGSHGISANAQTAGVRRVGTPVFWRSQHTFYRGVAEQVPLVTRFALGAGGHTQQRNGNELILFIRFSRTDTRSEERRVGKE